MSSLVPRPEAAALASLTGDNGNRSALVPIEWFVREHQPSRTGTGQVPPVFDEVLDTLPEEDAA